MLKKEPGNKNVKSSRWFRVQKVRQHTKVSCINFTNDLLNYKKLYELYEIIRFKTIMNYEVSNWN